MSLNTARCYVPKHLYTIVAKQNTPFIRCNMICPRSTQLYSEIYLLFSHSLTVIIISGCQLYVLKCFPLIAQCAGDCFLLNNLHMFHSNVKYTRSISLKTKHMLNLLLTFYQLSCASAVVMVTMSAILPGVQNAWQIYLRKCFTRGWKACKEKWMIIRQIWLRKSFIICTMFTKNGKSSCL